MTLTSCPRCSHASIKRRVEYSFEFLDKIAIFINVYLCPLKHKSCLTGLSFALLTILAISLRAAETRLFLLVPPIFIFGGLASLRSLHLRQLGRWLFPQAAGIALAIAQIATVFHYLPVSPITYGLLVAAVGYSLTVLVNNLSSGRPRSQAMLEPGLILIVFIGFALWIR